MTNDSTNSSSIDSFRGPLLALFCAFIAELFFVGISDKPDYLNALGRISALFISFFVVDRFARLSLPHYRQQVRDTFFLLLTLVGSVILVWFGRFVAVSVATYLSTNGTIPGLKVESLFYGIPFAAGALIIQAVLGLHVGLVFAVLQSLLVAVYFPHDSLLALFSLTTSLVACISLMRFRSRSAYLRAALQIALFSIPVVMGSLFLQDKPMAAEYLIRPVAAVVGAILCAFIASGITPVVEHVGGYVTDMRLIEMATLDHPLLKELSLGAQGTWNHSMVIGMMVESAAESVGANPVVARVGAYFHDIGKMTKPLYFVENQFGEENRHDKLSPSMSALIIRSHVKEGMEMAAKHKLPRVIVDMIPQHHGTSLIEYFYDKAVKEAEGTGQDVDINLYTYPGPKPQTKEAGILMLADGIEAASRTLSEPTFDRIQGLVQKLINKVFASGQLDECELTLHDLHLIAKCFTRVLHGIHHQRIAYAEPAEKTSDNGGDESQPEQPSEAPKEDLKRLGV